MELFPIELIRFVKDLHVKYWKKKRIKLTLDGSKIVV